MIVILNVNNVCTLNLLISILQASFVVDPTWKRACLISANDKWRQFKSRLTRDFVQNRIDYPNLNTPPYESVEDDWIEFVISRLTTRFKV